MHLLKLGPATRDARAYASVYVCGMLTCRQPYNYLFACLTGG